MLFYVVALKPSIGTVKHRWIKFIWIAQEQSLCRVHILGQLNIVNLWISQKWISCLLDGKSAIATQGTCKYDVLIPGETGLVWKTEHLERSFLTILEKRIAKSTVKRSQRINAGMTFWWQLYRVLFMWRSGILMFCRVSYIPGICCWAVKHEYLPMAVTTQICCWSWEEQHMGNTRCILASSRNGTRRKQSHFRPEM